MWCAIKTKKKKKIPRLGVSVSYLDMHKLLSLCGSQDILIESHRFRAQSMAHYRYQRPLWRHINLKREQALDSPWQWFMPGKAWFIIMMLVPAKYREHQGNAGIDSISIPA